MYTKASILQSLHTKRQVYQAGQTITHEGRPYVVRRVLVNGYEATYADQPWRSTIIPR